VPGTDLQDIFGGDAQLLNGVEIRTEDLEAHRRADAGAEHVDARPDGLGPGVLHPWKLHPLIHLFDQFRIAHGPLGAENARATGRSHCGR
jgi:hypothetical protein